MLDVYGRVLRCLLTMRSTRARGQVAVVIVRDRR